MCFFSKKFLISRHNLIEYGPRIERVHDLWILRNVVLLEVESWGGFNVYSVDKLSLKESRLFSWGFNLGSEGWVRHASHFNPRVGVRFLVCKRGRRNEALCLLKEVSVDHCKGATHIRCQL